MIFGSPVQICGLNPESLYHLVLEIRTICGFESTRACDRNRRPDRREKAMNIHEVYTHTITYATQPVTYTKDIVTSKYILETKR